MPLFHHHNAIAHHQGFGLLMRGAYLREQAEIALSQDRDGVPGIIPSLTGFRVSEALTPWATS
jgi:hypothetical protein